MEPRTNYPRLLLALLALLACAAAGAQGAFTQAGVAAAATEHSVLLRWLLPEHTYPEGGFVISREGGGSTVTTALPAPLPRAQAVGEGLVTPEEYDFLAAVFAPSGAAGSEGGADLGRAIATLTTVTRPHFARASGTLYEDAQVEAGVTYTYTVRTAAGALVGTAQVTGGDERPLAPVQGARADLQPEAVALRWTRPADETLLAAYNLYRSDGHGDGSTGSTVLLTDDPLILPLDEGDDPAFYLDESVEIGRSYTYVVEALDLFGRVAPRSEPVTIHIPDPTPLEVPQVTDGEVGDLSITIRWSPPTDDRARAVGVRRRTDPESNVGMTERILSLGTTSYTDHDVEGGETYYYSLVSVDGSGRVSEESALWAERGHNPTPPSAPTALRATPQEDGVVFTWQAPPEADVGSYRIYLSRQLDAGTEEFNFADATVEPRYHLTTLPGTLSEVQVLVRAVNTSDVEGPVSNVVRAAPLDTLAPPAPRLIEAIAGQGQVTLTWAGTANPDVGSLSLYRSAAGGTYELLQEGLAPNALEWVDATAQAGVEYRYALEAVDASGNRSQRSEPVTGIAFDLAAPAPVRGVSAALGEEGVSLGWTSESGLGYVVERARAGGERYLEISGVLSGGGFVDASGREGDVYRVFAVSASGVAGAPSDAVTVR